MPPRASSKRKSSTAPPLEEKNSPPAKKAKTKLDIKIEGLFDKYANKASGTIEPEGIVKLCSDLKVHYTDVRLLMLAWKVNAARQGYFTQVEWQEGLKALKVDTITKLKKALTELEKEVMQPPNFDDFYSFAFRFCLTEEKQRSVDIEGVCLLLQLVLGTTFPTQVDLFVEYLKVQQDYKVVNMDQWMNFLRFFIEISFPDLENYDCTEAWPLILDNFVEWMREKNR
ncbi:hypothetical protein ACFE04_003523 [Oxalis oulophora]